MSNVVKECKTKCKAIGKKCNKSTGRCRKRTNKDSPYVSPKKPMFLMVKKEKLSFSENT